MVFNRVCDGVWTEASNWSGALSGVWVERMDGVYMTFRGFEKCDVYVFDAKNDTCSYMYFAYFAYLPGYSVRETYDTGVLYKLIPTIMIAACQIPKPACSKIPGHYRLDNAALSLRRSMRK
jgi:hypothetical protein